MIDADTADLSYGAELKHFDDTYQAEMTAIDEMPPSRRQALEEFGPKLEAAKEKFYELSATHEGEPSEHDAELDDLLDDLREAYKRLTSKGDAGGPPLA